MVHIPPGGYRACKKCHEKDRNVIKCSEAFSKHSRHYTENLKCDICRKVGAAVYCNKYDSHIKKQAGL